MFISKYHDHCIKVFKTTNFKINKSSTFQSGNIFKKKYITFDWLLRFIQGSHTAP